MTSFDVFYFIFFIRSLYFNVLNLNFLNFNCYIVTFEFLYFFLILELLYYYSFLEGFIMLELVLDILQVLN